MNTYYKVVYILGLIAPFAIAASNFYLDPIWVNGPSTSMGPRLYHKLVQDSEDNIWTFGGVNSSYAEMAAEVWKLEATDNYNTWTTVVTTGSVPSPRGDYLFWILDDVIYLYGGEADFYSTIYSDFYSLDLSTLKWSLIANYDPTNTSNPTRNSGAVTWVDETTKTLWSFGGYGGNTGYDFLSDLWAYNVGSKTWTYHGGDGQGAAKPGKKGAIGQASKDYIPTSIWYALGAADTKGNVWIFSGQSFDGTQGEFGYTSELWRFTPSTLEWAYMGGTIGKTSQSSFVQPVYGTTGQYAADNWPPQSYGGNWVYSGNDVLTYYGGARANTSTSPSYAMSQVWSYNITLGQWAFISGDKGYVETAPVYGTQRQSSPSNKIGSRFEFGVSSAIAGHMIVHGGTHDAGGLSYISNGGKGTPVTGTFVLPVNLCLTEFNPCNSNANCAQNGSITECTCQSGYIGDGMGPNGCTMAPSTAGAPTAKTSAGSVVEAFVTFFSIAQLVILSELFRYPVGDSE